MNPDKDACTNLIDGWVLCRSKSNPGRKYYFNRKTGKSSWSKPEAVERSCCSKKAAKEKKRIQEKNKKEEIRKRALKRRSDGSNDEYYHGKCRKDLHHKEARMKNLHPEETYNKDSHSKRVSQRINSRDHGNTSTNVNKSTKKASTKNLANNRLVVLRNSLSKEVAEENCKNNDIKRIKVSPTCNQNDTPVKILKSELRSPNLNDSKCTITSQSPNSDSLQSTPSPSQFFAANKIISSMKAQLPEEFSVKEKQKDTFADIEQGICNQMPEYPSNKHPATPPQFSEANKLVSAIKSKLTYKMSVPQEESIMTFANAKERMDVLRKSLTETTNTTEIVKNVETVEKKEPIVNMNIEPKIIEKSPEAMEVEEVKEIEPSGPRSESEMNNVSIIQTNFVLVVDTNIFIRELTFIKNVINSHIKGYSDKPTLLIPWRVISELDKLKDNNNGNKALHKKARAAMEFLYKSLPDNDRIKGQSLRDANYHIFPCEVHDDEILNCCLQQVERGKSVLLLTDDRNLCNKATINNVQRISMEKLKCLIETEPKGLDNSISVRMKHYEDTMFQLLANILESEMRSKYGGLWQHVVHRAPPWQLGDVLASLLKHWRTVFCEVFPRIDHKFAELKTVHAKATKKPSALTESDADNFKVLCVDIASKCRIIPEYMDMAKAAVVRLGRYDVTALSDVTPPTIDITSPDITLSMDAVENAPAPNSRLVEAFESVWTLYSSYCAKLSTCLGVPHGLEDKLPGNQPAEVLSTKWAMFRCQVSSLTLAIKRVLSVERFDHIMEDQISCLETALKEGLALLSMDGGIVGRDELRTFCMRSRDMLQEAFAKLSQLTDLLDVCKNNMSS